VPTFFSKKLQAKLEQPRIVINFEGKFWKKVRKGLPRGTSSSFSFPCFYSEYHGSTYIQKSKTMDILILAGQVNIKAYTDHVFLSKDKMEICLTQWTGIPYTGSETLDGRQND
jgi:hypothetical protein